MTMQKPIEVVKKSIEVGLPKSFFADARAMSEDGLKDHTDEEILEALAEDILERYFNTEYFDIEGVVSALS